METNRIQKVIAILLVVLFLVTVTAGAVSAWGCGWNRCIYSSPKVVEDSANAHIVSSSSPATPYFVNQYKTVAVLNDPATSKPKTY